LLRDWTGLLFGAARGCRAGTWVDWAIDSFAMGRGPKPRFVDSPRGLGAGDDAGELLAKNFWVLFGGVRPSSI
jgi:hypothetical protein